MLQLPADFDPYHLWLGIPPAEQPPTLYRLLGVSQGESNVDVIHGAADRQTAHLRTFQAGRHADFAARLMSEVASARLLLIDAARRASYDAALGAAAPAAWTEGQHAAAAAPNPPAPAPAARPIPVEKAVAVFGPLDVLETVRTSPLGNVYRARHRETGRLLTLKLLPAESLAKREIVARFAREQKLTTGLQHRHLIRGLAAGTLEGTPYLVTEYVEGTDLAKLVELRGPLPVADGAAWCAQAARGLAQLHLHGVIHRNVKPHVLLVDRGGQVRVTNLFLARIEEGDGEQLTQMGQALGTYDYTAPEQARDARNVTAAADIYGLGCTLHFLLTGKPPYGGKTAMDKLKAHFTQPLPSLRAARSDVPAQLDAVFSRMLAKDPAGRYPDMGAAAEALETAGRPRRMPRWLGWLLRLKADRR